MLAAKSSEAECLLMVITALITFMSVSCHASALTLCPAVSSTHVVSWSPHYHRRQKNHSCIPAGACLQARETRYDGGMGIARPGEAWEPKQLESSKVMEEGELDLPQRRKIFKRKEKSFSKRERMRRGMRVTADSEIIFSSPGGNFPTSCFARGPSRASPSACATL